MNKKLIFKNILLTLSILFLVNLLFFNKSDSIFKLPVIASDETNQETLNQEPTLEYLEGKIISISKEEDESQSIAKVAITKGSLKGNIIEATIDEPESINVKYSVNHKVQILRQESPDGEIFTITDHIRNDSLLILLALFILTAILVAGKKGAFSFLSLILTFIAIFVILLPLINDGKNPVLSTLLTISVIIPIIFYVGQGFHKKTSIALISTIITLIISIGLAWLFTKITYLSGISSEEAMFLVSFGEQEINLQGLLFAGIIIGMLGALDDVTIAQTSIVNELYELNKDLSFTQLYLRALRVGKDHISSMINTLILVYTGASLPLLILLTNSDFSLSYMINSEIIAVEVVRTLVGSIGLILAVPITTAIASWYFSHEK